MAVESKIPPKAMMRIVNPIMRFLLKSPLHFLTSGFMMLLEMTGRKSGRRLLVPVSYHVLDGVVTGFSGAPWIGNLAGGASVDVWFKGRRRRARVEVVSDADEVAQGVWRTLSDIGPARAGQFAFKVTGAVPGVPEVRDALEGRRMLRFHWEGTAAGR